MALEISRCAASSNVAGLPGGTLLAYRPPPSALVSVSVARGWRLMPLLIRLAAALLAGLASALAGLAGALLVGLAATLLAGLAVLVAHAAGTPGFFRRELMRRSFLVGGSATLGGNFPLAFRIHGRKTTCAVVTALLVTRLASMASIARVASNFTCCLAGLRRLRPLIALPAVSAF